MTDKIIINGVDVSGCAYSIFPQTKYAKEISCTACKKDITKLNFCKNNPDCYYKQLARKTEELQSSKEQQFLIEQESISKSTYICELEKQLQAEQQKVKELEEGCTNLNKKYRLEQNARRAYKQALEEIKKTIHTTYDLLDFNKCNNLTAATIESRFNAVITSTLHRIRKCCEVLDER